MSVKPEWEAIRKAWHDWHYDIDDISEPPSYEFEYAFSMGMEFQKQLEETNNGSEQTLPKV